MKKDGTITIAGKDITIDASGKINVKASGNITMNGVKDPAELRAMGDGRRTRRRRTVGSTGW